MCIYIYIYISCIYIYISMYVVHSHFMGGSHPEPEPARAINRCRSLLPSGHRNPFCVDPLNLYHSTFDSCQMLSGCQLHWFWRIELPQTGLRRSVHFCTPPKYWVVFKTPKIGHLPTSDPIRKYLFLMLYVVLSRNNNHAVGITLLIC